MTVAGAHHCISCGATLDGVAKAGKIKCSFCGTVNAIASQGGNENCCPQCNAANSLAAKFCGECGAPLIVDCPKCGAPNRSELKYCTKCGVDLREEYSRQQKLEQARREQEARQSLQPRPIPLYAPLIAPPRSSTLATVSLIAGILGLLQIVPIIGPIAAIITGHMARSEIRKSGGMVSGKGMATGGLILGYVTIVIGLFALCVFFIFPLLSIPFIGNTY